MTLVDTSLIAVCKLRSQRYTPKTHKNKQNDLTNLYTQIQLNQSTLYVGFLDDRYFFRLTDNATQMTEIYMETKKSDWLKYLKMYYSLYKTCSKDNHLIKRLRPDYGSELQSFKANEQMEKKGIIFEPSTSYSQEQNGVSEQTKRIIMDMTKAIIFESNIDINFQPKLVLAMTYVKTINLQKHYCRTSIPTKLLLENIPISLISIYQALPSTYFYIKKNKY